VVLQSSRFGNVVVVVFLFAQALDGVLTYVGVTTFGMRVEGNPLLGWLMTELGHGVALTTTKAAAVVFGIALHRSAVHRVVAALAAFYLAVAVMPWLGILFFAP